jgi:pimeloyl-ACP methyl ester carboxylesterase
VHRVRRALIASVAAALVLAACGGNGLDVAAGRDRSATTTTRPAGTTTTTAPPSSTTTAPPAAPAAPSTGSGFPEGWTPPPLTWSSCQGHARFECATLHVPLDWSNPTGAQIGLAVARQRATGDRIGSLLTNPGGPGASGLQFLFGKPLQEPLLERFDLVSWDPRGVGSSTHLFCGSRVSSFLHLDPDPDDPAEQQAIDAAAKAVADECAAKDGQLLPHIGTDDTARDLEALRLALGDPQLTYFGFSYGTFIGERYLALFPTHVRAIVLDGVVNPTEGLEGLLTGQTTAMTAAIGRAFASCGQSRSCPLADPAATFDQVKARVERSPLPVGGGTLGPAELATGAIYATYDPQLWPALNRALAAAARGDGDPMSSLANGYYDIGDWTAYAGITCLDSAHPTGSQAYRAFVQGLRAASPDFGGPIGNEMLPCAYWPVSRPVTGPVTGAGSPPILVVGNKGDAATPYDDAVFVAGMLADGHLLSYDGEGHTSYGRDECVDDAIHQYLIDLVVPPEDPQCGGGGGVPAP